LLAWVSFAPSSFAALGGTVSAYPFTAQVTFVADPTGGFVGSASWPQGLPPGTKVWFQFLVEDGSTLPGITLSNGVLAKTP
jgi:hypothetical protein